MKGRQASLTIIGMTVFVDMFGIGLAFPVLPKLIEQFTGDVAEAPYLYGLLAVYALAQFVCAPLLGSLSDRYGRRPVILASLLGLGIDYLIIAFAPDLWWFAFGRVVAGIMGASYLAAGAYIADISPPEQRAQNYGLIGATFGAGFIAGPLVGGVLGGLDLRLPFLVAAVFSFVNLLFAVFALPESLPTERRRPFNLAEANPVGALLAVSRRPALLGLIGVFALAALANRAAEVTWVLYTGYRYGWDTAQTGLSLAAVGVLFVVGQGVLVRVVVPRFGERRTVIVGLAVAALTLVLYGLATEGWMVYPVLALSVFGWTIGAPALQGILSRAVPGNEQGLLQGAVGSVTSATNIVGPPLWTGLFGYFVGSGAPFALPGAAFLVAALVTLLALALTLRSFATPVAIGVADGAPLPDSSY